MKLHRNYSGFMELLNKHRIEWCLIKDYDYLIKTGYDNEVDLIAFGKNREKIRRLARSQDWNESALNAVNTHLIFWKFEGLKPFRIDIHIDRALATAVPWLSAKEILSNKVKDGHIWTASPPYELAILIVASLRGRELKPHRIKRAKQLKGCVEEAEYILRKHISSSDMHHHYDNLANGKKFRRLPVIFRLRISGLVRHLLLYPRLLLSRIKHPAPVVAVKNSRDALKFMGSLDKSKLNVTYADSFIFIKRLTSDLVITANESANTQYRYDSLNINNILSDLYGGKGVH